jgi:hypothetical protein
VVLNSNLLPLAQAYFPRAPRCSRWRSLLLTTSTCCQGINREDGGKSRLGWRSSPTPYPRCTPNHGVDMLRWTSS